MGISNLFNILQGSSFEHINYTINSREEQENKSSTAFSYSVKSDRMSISQATMQLLATTVSLALVLFLGYCLGW